MRSLFTISYFVVTVAACIPQWAPHKDAGGDGVSAVDGEEAGADDDVPDSGLDAGAGREGDGSSLESTPDSAMNNADAARDAAPPAADGGCADGYVEQNGSCQDINECFEGTHACHMTASCENTDGGYDCNCPLGYSGGTSAGFACAPRIAVGGSDTGGAIEQHQCVVSSDSTVRCWGDNSVGQLGDGTNVTRASPVGVLRDAALVSIGGGSACAVVIDGTVRCWGDNANGQLGDGTILNQPEPVSVPELTGVVSVSVGTAHSCAVLRDGSIKCWGRNSEGQLGSGDSASTPVRAPVRARGVSEASNVYAFGDQTCAILRSGRVQCWGKGILGDPAVATSLTPVDVEFPGAFMRLTIGPFHVCGVQNDGDIVCWGPPALGGNGMIIGGDVGPKRVMGASATAVDIGIYATCIIEPSGTMKWWDAQTKPALVDGVTHAVAMSGWGIRMCHLNVDGSLSCWTINNATLTQPMSVPGVDLW